MKLLIASDIHGSDLYCEKLICAFERECADKILLLGDILYHGPRNNLPLEYGPKKVIERLNSLKDKILCVRGNCDTEVDQMVLKFPILADYAVVSVDDLTIYATHGHVYNNDKLPPIQSGDILLHGHTHIQALEKRGTYYYLNPGSVSIPKNNNEHSYMVYENRCFTIKNLDGEKIDSIVV